MQYQQYQVPPYAQYRANEFVPGLSAIDALMNCGGAAATLIGALLEYGRHEEFSITELPVSSVVGFEAARARARRLDGERASQRLRVRMCTRWYTT